MLKYFCLSTGYSVSSFVANKKLVFNYDFIFYIDFSLLQYSEMEAILGDIDRARAIFELAIAQTLLDMPEVLYQFEIKSVGMFLSF